MKRIIPFIVYGVLLLFTACATEDLAIENGPSEPVFTVTADFGGEEINLSAGEDDFYLYTENGYIPGGTNFSPTTRFGKTSSCETNCEESFSIEIVNIPVAELDDYFGLIPNNEKFDLRSDIESPGHIIISYQTAVGQYFSTSLGPQTPSSNINISSIQDYEPNENGQQTKLLEVDFTCQLYNESGGSVSLTEGQMVFAVALP